MKHVLIFRGGRHLSFGQEICQPMKSLQLMTNISRAELVTTLGYRDTVGRAVLAASQPVYGLVEGPRVVIGRGEDSSGVCLKWVLGLFHIYTAALERCIGKFLYREHVGHFHVSCLD